MAEKAGVVSVRTERAPSRLLLPLIVTGFLAVMLAWLGLTQFLNALTLGAVYALIALGYTMVYGIIELINFAHGDVFMVGTFVSMFVSGTLLQEKNGIEDLPSLVTGLALVFVLTIAVMAVIGALIERFAYRPLRKAPKLAPLITAIGVSFILQNVALVIAGSGDRKTRRSRTIGFPRIGGGRREGFEQRPGRGGNGLVGSCHCAPPAWPWPVAPQCNSSADCRFLPSTNSHPMPACRSRTGRS